MWKDTIGPWEERPGHYNDIWNYWSDDGIGYLEYLQVCIYFSFITMVLNLPYLIVE